MGRIVPEVEDSFAQKILDKSINLKKIPTRRKFGLIRLPAVLEYAAQNKIAGMSDKNFRSDVKQLMSIIYNYKLPDDQDTLKLKRADIKTQLEIRDKIKNRPDYDPEKFEFPEEKVIARYELQQLINGTLENKRRDWHYYEYDEYASCLYMATRLSSNYSCLKTVMNEIHDLYPSFSPNSVLDFGSGMGTTIWAVEETWPKTVREFMNIDISNEQQSLCEYLLRGGKYSGDQLSNVFHRQYLPASNKTKYDLVVAAFSMLDLPNSHLRAQTIENLWQKTNDLLVIIERGNKSGFTAINEARHFILDISSHDVTNRVKLTTQTKPKTGLNIPDAHILAPCPHEYLCPRANMPSRKSMDTCRFKVVFEPLEIGERKSPFLNEQFSYVVLKKGAHPSYYETDSNSSIRFPRVVEKRISSGSKKMFRICCPNGNLAECFITKRKYGKAAYEIAKSCKWGDILPIKINDTYEKLSHSKRDIDKTEEETIG